MHTSTEVPFPRLIKLIRKSRGLSLEKASQAIGVSRAAWERWESGVSPHPGVEKSVREWCGPSSEFGERAN